MTDYLGRLEESIKNMNSRIDNLYTLEITNLKVQMGKIETQVKIYAGIAGTIGAVVGAAIMKLVVK